jgi:hypothetical protein
MSVKYHFVSGKKYSHKDHALTGVVGVSLMQKAESIGNI